MRGGGAEEKRRALAGTPDQLSFRRGLAVRVCVCVIVCICRSTGRPGFCAPQLLTCFPLKLERLKKGVNREGEGPAKAIDGCGRLYTVHRTLPLFSQLARRSHLPTPPLSLTTSLPRSHILMQKRQHFLSLNNAEFNIILF